MSNFLFLKNVYPKIFEPILQAEASYWLKIRDSAARMRDALDVYDKVIAKKNISPEDHFGKDISIDFKERDKDSGCFTYDFKSRLQYGPRLESEPQCESDSKSKYRYRYGFVRDFSNAGHHSATQRSYVTNIPHEVYLKPEILEEAMKIFHDAMVKLMQMKEANFTHEFYLEGTPILEFFIDPPSIRLSGAGYEKYFAHRPQAGDPETTEYAIIYRYPPEESAEAEARVLHQEFILRLIRVDEKLRRQRVLPPRMDKREGRDGHFFVIYLFNENPSDTLIFNPRNKNKLAAMSLPEKARLCKDIAATLYEFHAAGVFHRNLTSHAVLLETLETGEKIPTIIDLNFAKILNSEKTIGKQHLVYVSERQKNNIKYFPDMPINEDTDSRMLDIYALGVLFRDIFTDGVEDIKTRVKLSAVYTQEVSKYKPGEIADFKTTWGKLFEKMDQIDDLCACVKTISDSEKKAKEEKMAELKEAWKKLSAAMDQIMHPENMSEPDTTSDSGDKHVEVLPASDENADDGTGDQTNLKEVSEDVETMSRSADMPDSGNIEAESGAGTSPVSLKERKFNVWDTLREWIKKCVLWLRRNDTKDVTASGSDSARQDKKGRRKKRSKKRKKR
jgi:serine/threonine protein kinase